MRKMLSKSTFMYGCQCPKRLYLHKFKPSVADPYDELAMLIFKRGTDVGVLAQGLFPDGIDAQGEDPYPGFEAAKRTAAYMQVQREVIYEATFIYQDVLVAVDILVKTPTGYDVYEVKSTNSAKAQHNQDGAVQYFVLNGAGVKINSFNILHFNASYVRHGELELDKLFKATNITKACVKQQGWVEDNILDFQKLLKAGVEPDIAMGKQCDKPYPCNFQGYCTALNPPETDQSKSLSEEIRFNTAHLRFFFSEIEYPIHFFDFESVMYGVPEYDDSRPYQQLPFQYSLHIQRKKNSPLEHKEFLASNTGDPRRAIIEQMIQDLGDEGSIVVWYQAFEETRLVELARDFPEHQKAIYAIIDRLRDLIVPFKQGLVDSEAFGGSSSIKRVLPVLVPELNYENLTIQEGGIASYIFGQISSMPHQEAEQTRKDLLEYCKMDTYAMVKIWERLTKEVEDSEQSDAKLRSS